MFHPHFHCLVAVKSSYFTNTRQYASYEDVRQLWSKANRSEKLLQCSVGAIKGNDTLGFAEVSKYCLKPLDFKQEYEADNAYIIYTLAYTLKGTRFIQTYGVIKDVFSEIKKADKSDSDSNFAQMFEYRWDYRQHKYMRLGDS